MVHAREASAAAASVREELLASRTSFIPETVLSHVSKVELVRTAAEAGYLVALHVVFVPASLCVARVRERVVDGGHDVPEHRIRQRYDRLWSLVVHARTLADRTHFHDDTRAADPLRLVVTFEHDVALGDPSWPRWTPAELWPETDPARSRRQGGVVRRDSTWGACPAQPQVAGDVGLGGQGAAA